MMQKMNTIITHYGKGAHEEQFLQRTRYRILRRFSVIWQHLRKALNPSKKAPVILHWDHEKSLDIMHNF